MPTPAQLYEDALWESRQLEPNELLVCLCHAKHAYENGQPVDHAWVTTDRLVARTKLSKGAVIKARKGAIAKGWLVDIGPRPGHSQIRMYRLAVPGREVSVPSDPRARNAKGRFVKQTGPRMEPVHVVDRSPIEPQVRDSPAQTGPQMEPVHNMDGNRSTDGPGTGPPRGPESLTESPTESLSSATASSERGEREDLNEKNDRAEPDRFTARLMAEHVATADEVAAVLAAASRDGIRNVSAWSASAVGREDFARRLAELRTKRVPRPQSSCRHSGVEDPENPGTCLLCKTDAMQREKRTATPDQPAEPALPADESDAEAHARLAEILARGRAARERQERQKTARNRRPVPLAEVIDPKVWEQREAVLQREGHRELPEVEEPLEQEDAASA